MRQKEPQRSNGEPCEPILVIDDLWVAVEGKEILKGVTLSIAKGEINALMGPNGSGKSTLSNTLMGHPRYEIRRGRVLFRGEDILPLAPDERARKGLFLAFQYPTAVPGVTMVNFLRSMLKARRGQDVSAKEFRKLLVEKMNVLEMDESFAKRYLNDGLSGGEKKRNEILQLALFQPEMAILDETDSGLDIDALRVVAAGINRLMNDEMGMLIITHYQRMLNYVTPHRVHVLVDGRIARSGGKELALELEEKGYDEIVQAARLNDLNLERATA